MNLYRLVDRLYNKKIDAGGLAVFRIFYSLVLLCEVIQLFYFRHLIFDKIPFVEPAEIDLAPAMIAWIMAIIFLVLGLFTRQAAIINYLFSLVFIATIDTYEYHMFYVYMGVNFLLIFLSVSQVNSLDRLRKKLIYSSSKFHYNPPRVVSVLNYYVVLLVAVAFVYVDSMFFKVLSHNWMSGLGMWLPASLPYMTHVDASILLNVKWMALGLGYLTVVFEATFIFLFFRKKWRVLILIIGVGLHIGIFIVFPIPWFGLGVTAIYMLLVPVSWWGKLTNLLSFKSPRVTFFYDGECPLCYRTVIVLKHLDVLRAVEFQGLQSGGFQRKELEAFSREELIHNIFSLTRKGKILKGIDTYVFLFKRIPALTIPGLLMSIPGVHHIARWVYRKIASSRYVERCTDDTCGYLAPPVFHDVDDVKLLHGFHVKQIKVGLITLGLVLITLLQLNVSYNARLFVAARKKIGLDGTQVERMIETVATPTRKASKIFLGITNHPVFMDWHFNGYNHIIGIEAKLKDGTRIWVPIIDRKGHSTFYAYSFTFVKWTFRVNGPKVDEYRLQKGIRDFTAFWLYKNGMNTTNAHFNVWVKKIDIPNAWENNFLEKQTQNKWIDAGSVDWVDNTFHFRLIEIESL